MLRQPFNRNNKELFFSHRNDLLFVVGTAGFAHSVRHHKSSAFAAAYESRRRHFPVCMSLISPGLGSFIFWADGHCSHLLCEKWLCKSENRAEPLICSHVAYR